MEGPQIVMSRIFSKPFNDWLPYLQSKHVIETDLFLKLSDVS